jgi:hypothetical protein
VVEPHRQAAQRAHPDHPQIDLAGRGGFYLGITIYRIQQAAPLSPVALSAMAITLVFFVGLFATGGILSAVKTAPGLVLKIHQVMPYLVILSSSASLYLLPVLKQSAMQ